MLFLISFGLTLLFAHICTTQLQKCYSRFGNLTPDLPCDPSANVSSCCGAGYRCITSLYCEQEDGWGLLGTCTDPTWMDPACPFIQLQSGDYSFDATLNTTDCLDGTTCPNQGNDTCCINKQGVSVVSYRNTGVIPKTFTALTSYYEAGGYTIPTTAVAASITELSAPPSVASSVASSAAPSAAPSPAPNGTQPSSNLSSGAKAGIGVGVAVGAVAVAVVAFLLIRRYRAKRQYHGQRETRGYENMRHADGTLVAEVHGAEKHEIHGDSVRMKALKKHELTGQLPPPRVEMDAASSERSRFHELDVPR